METMETLENHGNHGNRGNHGNHGNRRCGIETVANHIEIMETMENLRKHRPRSGGTSEPNLEVQANQIWRYKRTPAPLRRCLNVLGLAEGPPHTYINIYICTININYVVYFEI